MKKNFKVITINGIRGAIVAVFIVMGLIASFTAFKIFLLIILAASPIKFMVMYKQRLIRKELIARNKELGIESSENVVL